MRTKETEKKDKDIMADKIIISIMNNMIMRGRNRSENKWFCFRI